MLFNVLLINSYNFILSSKKYVIVFILSVFFSIQINASDINFENVLNSVVKIYTANLTNDFEIEKFFKVKKFSNDFNVSTASGIIFDSENAYIITNSHVIEGKNLIKVELYNGLIFKGRVITQDKGIDLAILKLVNTSKLKLSPIKISSKRSFKLGDEVFAIGNPFNIGLSITKGIISAVRSTANGFNLDIGELIQTDFVLNPGNSGGPLLNSKGEIIGINSAVFLPKGTVTGISFAIPSNLVYLFINKSLKGEKLRKYWLGFSANTFDDSAHNEEQLKKSKGLQITQVYDNSPAAKIGLKEGDIVVSVNNVATNSVPSMNLSIVSLENNNTIPIIIYRNDKLIKLKIIPEIFSGNIDITLITDGLLNGIKITDNSPFSSYDLNIPYLKKGVIVYNVSDNSDAKKLGLKFKDVIISINNKSITSVNNMLNILQEDKTLKSIIFLRGNTQIEVNIK